MNLEKIFEIYSVEKIPSNLVKIWGGEHGYPAYDRKKVFLGWVDDMQNPQNIMTKKGQKNKIDNFGLKFTNYVSIKSTPPFGLGVEVLDLPENCNVVVLCYNEGYGLKPYALKLPHQIYVKGLKKKMKENPSIKYFTVIPACSAEYVNLTEE
jgi:hypothetical protein